MPSRIHRYLVAVSFGALGIYGLTLFAEDWMWSGIFVCLALVGIACVLVLDLRWAKPLVILCASFLIGLGGWKTFGFLRFLIETSGDSDVWDYFSWREIAAEFGVVLMILWIPAGYF